MPLEAGLSLGVYQVTAKVGAGGMGEVYRARDTTLDRDVALKILPDAFGADRERLARFRREARVLAALNHPNIAAIHGLEESGGSPALVLEYVEGPTLQELIGSPSSGTPHPSPFPRGEKGAGTPLPLEEAVPIARQIAAALEAAHEQGIVHRDLKPANVKVKPDGTVKVLDFGLAKALAGDAAPDAGDAESPTVTAATRAGEILGTVAYMSPEQARGKVLDKRADIWAFGVVLFEMTTGHRPFGGGTTTETLAAALTQEPAWDEVPVELRPLLRRCLEKDPKKRLRDIGEAPFLLQSEAALAGPAASGRSARDWIPWTAAALLAAALGLVLGLGRPDPASPPPMRFTVATGASDLLGPTMAISPDGTRVAYRAPLPEGPPALATRLLSESNETILAGTQGAYNPVFSPDGRWIAFHSLISGSLMKVPVEGGSPIALADTALGRGASWGDDGTIIAELDGFSGLWRISDEGGPTERLTRPSRDRHYWPHILPGGRSVIYSAGPHGLLENGRIEAVPLEGGEATTVLEGGFQAHYVPSGETDGHLVYIRSGGLYAAPFDPARLELLGPSVQIADDVAATGSNFGAALSASASGTVAYSSGRVDLEWPLAWMDESGVLEALPLEPGPYYTPRVSPEGGRVALSVGSDRGHDVFVYDIVRDSMTRLTSSGDANLWPVWAPDGEHVVYTSLTDDQGVLWWARADGTSPPARLHAGPNGIRQIAISPDGRYIGYTGQDPETSGDLWILPLEYDGSGVPTAGEARAVIQTAFSEGVPAFSPDGRWLAYTSNELGPYGVWVQDFPDLNGRWQVAGDGGYTFWSRTAPELFYWGASGGYVVSYEADGERFIPGRPLLWPTPAFAPMPIGFEPLDLAPDGRRFLVLPDAATDASAQVTFLLNFADELRTRAPIP